MVADMTPGSNPENIILHLVGGSRVPNGIRSGWHHVREPVLFVCPRFSYWEFSEKLIIYQAKNSTGCLK